MLLPARIVLENGPGELCFATIVLPLSDPHSISPAFEVDISTALAFFASSYEAIILSSMALTWSNIFCSVRTDLLLSAVSPTFARLPDGSDGLKFFLVDEDALW